MPWRILEFTMRSYSDVLSRGGVERPGDLQYKASLDYIREFTISSELVAKQKQMAKEMKTKEKEALPGIPTLAGSEIQNHPSSSCIHICLGQCCHKI